MLKTTIVNLNRRYSNKSKLWLKLSHRWPSSNWWKCKDKTLQTNKWNSFTPRHLQILKWWFPINSKPGPCKMKILSCKNKYNSWRKTSIWPNMPKLILIIKNYLDIVRSWENILKAQLWILTINNKLLGNKGEPSKTWKKMKLTKEK